LMAITIARACGAAMVFATEINPHRRELAKQMGADVALDPTQSNVVEQLREATGGAGADVLLEMSGNPAAIHQGFQMLRQGGRASLLGIPSDPVTFDLVNDVIFKGATVQGIYGRKMFETWVQMTELLKHGRLNLDPLFKEHLPIEDFEQAFSLLQSGQAGKILLYPNGVNA
jgi:threonine 3-dehydrogenase